jgi:hypothetical protein
MRKSTSVHDMLQCYSFYTHSIDRVDSFPKDSKPRLINNQGYLLFGPTNYQNAFSNLGMFLPSNKMLLLFDLRLVFNGELEKI